MTLNEIKYTIKGRTNSGLISCKSQNNLNFDMSALLSSLGLSGSKVFTKVRTMGMLSCPSHNHLHFDKSSFVNGYLKTGPHYP